MYLYTVRAGGVDCAPVVPLVLVLYEVRYVGHVAGTTETCLLVLFLYVCQLSRGTVRTTAVDQVLGTRLVPRTWAPSISQG